MSWPPAEIPIDETLVRALLGDQFPHLVERRVFPVGDGFDNSMWRLGNNLVVRLPRRAAAVATTMNELRWLPIVAARASLQTPLPLLAGRPSDLFPWPWSITAWIDGVPGDEVDPNTTGTSARALATFLKGLHAEAPSDAPINPFRSVALSERSTTFEERLVNVGSLVDAATLSSLWETCASMTPWTSPPRWLHGDFHPGNTVYRHGDVVGVIDFGDLCAGDPATDLAGGLLSLPYHALEDFFSSYGLDDDAMLVRTIGWTILFGLMMVSLGVEGRSSYLRVGHHSLENATLVAAAL